MIKEIVYKTIDTCDIALDIHTSSVISTLPLPILIWFHGGGLLQGSRKSVAPHLLAGVENHRYCLVSVDYRLAPQASVADIVSDCLDAVDYVRQHARSKVDVAILTDDISVSGSSAGGYLALLVALRDSKLRSCLAIYPITNPVGTFFTTPQETPDYSVESLQPYLDTMAPVSSSNPRESVRSTMYFHMLRSANLASLLQLEASQAGNDTDYIVASEIRAKRDRHLMCPTYIVHGDADKFVGVEQSHEVRDALEEIGCEVVYEEAEGEDHLYDLRPEVTMSAMYEFFDKHRLHPHATGLDSSYGSAITSNTSNSGTSQSNTVASTANTTSMSTTSTNTDNTTEFTRSPPSELDSSESDSSSDDATDSTTSYDSDLAEEHWAQSIHELTLVLNLIFLPLAGKYFGRQFALWGWGKWMTWRFPNLRIVQNKGVQRATSAVVAGISG